jgi:hypothetical protein
MIKKGNTKSEEEETQKAQSYQRYFFALFVSVFALFVFPRSKLNAIATPQRCGLIFAL